MKRTTKYVDLTELNGERIGKLGAPVHPGFLASPEQVRRDLKTVKVTVELEPASLEYFRREARRRGKRPDKIMGRILRAHALAGA